jgi:hypothetical protein
MAKHKNEQKTSESSPEVLEIRFFSERERDIRALREKIQRLEREISMATPETIDGLQKDLNLAVEALKAMDGPSIDMG